MKVRNSLRSGIAIAAFLGMLLTATSASALTGAIFTTDVSCNGTNVNIFTDKADVFLDGGPRHGGAAGLPDGNYWVKVTVPNGDMLGMSPTANVHVTDGSFDTCYQLAVILNSTSSGYTTAGYDDTTNGGGVYKVWISDQSDFSGGNTKTDNFKVKGSTLPPPPLSGSISGMKFEDMNANGVMDADDHGLSGWEIDLMDASGATVLDIANTDADGNYSFSNVPVGTYQVCEVMQANWYASAPTTSDPNCRNPVVVTANTATTGMDFGNYQMAKLTVIKHVINDNGGTAVAGDFTMNVHLPGPVTMSDSGSETGTVVFVKPGSVYSVDENATTTYAQVLPADADCAGTTISGADITCTVTNDDIAPKLTLNKIVDNTNGGNAVESTWTLTANGGTAGTLSGLGAAGNNDVVSGNTFQAGTYALSESAGPNYYQASQWSCTGDVTNTGNSVVIGVGQTATCTVTNTYTPPTRTLGFWSTHTNYTNVQFGAAFPSGMQIGSGAHKGIITNTQTNGQSQLYGAYFSSIPYLSNGKTKRSALDQARMILLQQLVTAKLNCGVFGCSAAVQAQIATADSHYASGTAAQILADSSILDAFNNSGDPVAIVGNTGTGTQSASQKLANKVFWDTP